MKFYLAREGVAFGPYTEFQVLESVRLGIFESSDLALAENGKEWMEVARLLPLSGSPRKQPPDMPSAPLLGVDDGKEPVETPALLSSAEALREQRSGKASAKPLGEHYLREHELLFADVPVASFATEFTREKLVVGAVPLVVILGLLALAAVLRHHEPSSRAEANARFSQKPPAVQSMTKGNSLLMPVSLPVGNATSAKEVPAATPEVRAASSPAPAEPPAASPSPGRKIEGQMYISAADGLNYAPSYVEVRLYPLTLLKPYLEKRGSEASAKFAELKSQIQMAEANKELLRKASDAAFDAFVQAEAGSPNKAALEQASVEAKKAREAAANTYYQLMQDREDLLSGAFYLEDLPKTADTTQTDSDGRFSFQVPADGEFGVVAGVQKNGDVSPKRYYWFVPVNVGGEPKKEVLLSNNNLSSQGYVDSLVQTVD